MDLWGRNMIKKYQEHDQILARATPSTTNNTTLYAPIGNQIKEINKIVITNIHTSDVTVDIYLCLSAASPAVSNALFYQVNIKANSTEILEGAGLPIRGIQSDSLVCKVSNASKINFIVLGQEMGQP